MKDLRRRRLLPVVLLAMSITLGGLSACGDDIDRARLQEERLERERKEAAALARQEERVRQLERQLRERRSGQAAAPASGGGQSAGTAVSGGCVNEKIPADVRAQLSDAAGTPDPAIQGSVYYGSCGGQRWALASFPSSPGSGVFRRVGGAWQYLGTISEARCNVPNELLALWRQPRC